MSAPVPGPVSDWLNYDELPAATRDAIRHGAATADPADLVLRARACQWQLEQVPAEQMKARVMSADPDLGLFGGTFAAYHHWYLARGNVPEHGLSHWPVLEHHPGDIAGGYLDDGWHRLHSYLRAGDRSIPLLRHRPRTEQRCPAAAA